MDASVYLTPIGMIKTFIHHDGAFGDLLLSLPAIDLLRKSSDRLHLASAAEGGRLLLEAGVVDEWSPVGSAFYSPLYSSPLSAAIYDFLKEHDKAVVFTSRRDSVAAQSITSVISESLIVETIPQEGNSCHAAEHRVLQLGGLPATARDYRLGIPWVRTAEAKHFLQDSGYDFSRPLITVHPGSGGSRKCWPLAHYLELLLMIYEYGEPFVLLLSGPAEEEAIHGELSSFAEVNRGRAAFLGSGELGLVAALLSLADVHIGNDSGISHLAGFVGARVVVLFGPTDPAIWRPVGRDTVVVKSGAGCAPCGDARSRLCAERICFMGVSPRTVFMAVAGMMDASRPNVHRSHVDHDLQG